MKPVLSAPACLLLSTLIACGRSQTPPASASSPGAASTEPAGEVLPSGAMLGPDGFKCALSVKEWPVRISAGTPSTITVTVQNLSQENWPHYTKGHSPQYSVNLGARWYPAGAKAARKEDQRALLEKDVPPGASITLDMALEAPAAGNYRLRIEPNQEGVAWFADKGGCKAEADVAVQ